VLFGSVEEQFSLEYDDLVDTCMRSSGFDDFSYRQFLGPAVVEPEPQFQDESDSIRERGSGLTYSMFFGTIGLSQPEETGPVAGWANVDLESDLGQKLVVALYDGPIASPLTGPYELGCQFWASDQLTQAHPEYAVVAEAALQYSERVTSSVLESPEYQALELEWSDCMAEAGFGGLVRPGDQLELIISRATSLAEQGLTSASPEVMALLEYDREVSLSSFGCFDRIHDRREAMKSAVAKEIVSEFPEVGEVLND